MRILSICSDNLVKCIEQEINKKMIKIEFNTLIDFLYIKDKKNDVINIDYDEVYIDILSFLKEHYIKNNSISTNNTNGSGILSDEEKKKVFIQSVNIIINCIAKNIHLDKINFIKIFFDEIVSGSKEINYILDDIYSEIIINNPTINIIECTGVVKDNEEIELLSFNKQDKERYRNEMVYSSTCNIRYIFEKSKLFNKDKLIIVFSAFSKDKPKYNYVNTLKCIDCNKVFILDDYGTKGTYYIGLDGKFDIETSVISLITEIMAKYNITFKNIISAGSSKGGSAALYYGLKYNFGEIIVGSPQYKIGTYLCDLSIKDYANEIFGSYSISNRVKYDNLINLIIKKNQYTNINILTGLGDHQYKRVFKEFEDEAEILKLKLNEKLIDISSHDEISKKFPEYLLENVIRVLRGKGCIQNNKILNIFKRL
ncbi:accessory Sec system protein Asp2 [Clostridium baratii]|uniref:accessory Sec system protein Asp2 n=1 Tax=Clostridium baratii TaxID=1561 RepID=UPI0006C7084A|nr:accessory Sec system protein Asp2 [Clostridium baratii]CUP47935.1 accessory Sec system protein Asp2 [Clostridium baratii]